jgi:hypothetical protein
MVHYRKLLMEVMAYETKLVEGERRGRDAVKKEEEDERERDIVQRPEEEEWEEGNEEEEVEGGEDN